MAKSNTCVLSTDSGLKNGKRMKPFHFGLITKYASFRSKIVALTAANV